MSIMRQSIASRTTLLRWSQSALSPSTICRSCAASILRGPLSGARSVTTDSRTRLSNIWAPTSQSKEKTGDEEDIHSILVRAGFLRQAYTGIFHMLPLGVRVQDKIEQIIDENMKAIGASKVSLSSISSEILWRRTGRLEKMNKELFKFKDRKDVKFLLSPTHEEEITSLVQSDVSSFRQLPIRVYQISRKYRDERRPRGGLLRGREFTMKDLYTFDLTSTDALGTYKDVQKAYTNIFEALSVPHIFCEADTGDMGGSLSHEYHYVSPLGEDTLALCTECGYSANEERLVLPPPNTKIFVDEAKEVVVWHGITKDKLGLIKVYFPRRASQVIYDSDSEDGKKTIWKANEVNTNAVRDILGNETDDLDPTFDSYNAYTQWVENFTAYPGGQDGKRAKFSKIIKMYDCRLLEGDGVNKLSTFSNHADVQYESTATLAESKDGSRQEPATGTFGEYTSKQIPTTVITKKRDPETSESQPVNLLRVNDGDVCPDCGSDSLSVARSIELGHTFHLGTRYSDPMNAFAKTSDNEYVAMEMGCHGIGVTRLIAAIADALRDERGLCWPQSIAPYAVVIVYPWDRDQDWARSGGEEVYDYLTALDTKKLPDNDIVLDDRQESLPWKMKDADLIGYSVMIVVGRRWKDGDRVVEIQERRTGVKKEADFKGLETMLLDMLK